MKKSASLMIAAGATALTAWTADAATLDSRYNTLTGQAPVVIAHRGAPAYLPENTIGGNELSADMGAEWIETDVMMTKDRVLIAMHDTTLDRTTNVEDFYAPRNGGYAVADFTYAELQALTVQPTGTGNWTYPGFTPSDDRPYRIPTFADMLDGLTDYNDANGTNVGILTEGKYEYDAATNRAVVQTLIDKGYASPDKSVLQSFDFNNVREYAALLDIYGVDMGVAQLGSGRQVDGIWTISNRQSFETLATYTDTVALSYGSITRDLIDAAHDLGLSVYGWTFRPEDQAQADQMASLFLDWGLDGFITDNPDYLRSTVDDYAIAPVPLPGALPLMGAGIAAFAVLRRRRKAA